MKKPFEINEEFGSGVVAITRVEDNDLSFRVEQGSKIKWSEKSGGGIGFGFSFETSRLHQQKFALEQAKKSGSLIPETDRFARIWVDSSFCELIGYCYATNTLQILYPRGVIYNYMHVPPIIWTALLMTVVKGESVGKVVTNLVKKGGYEYEKQN